MKCGLEGFAIASVLHGVYDFVVLHNPAWALPVAALGILILWVWRLKLMRELHLNAVEASNGTNDRGHREPGCE